MSTCGHEVLVRAEDGSGTYWCGDCGAQLVLLDAVVDTLTEHFLTKTVCGDFKRAISVVEAFRA